MPFLLSNAQDDEITILNGVLSLNNTKAGDIMTPIKDVLTLSADTKLDHDQIDEILFVLLLLDLFDADIAPFVSRRSALLIWPLLLDMQAERVFSNPYPRTRKAQVVHRNAPHKKSSFSSLPSPPPPSFHAETFYLMVSIYQRPLFLSPLPQQLLLYNPEESLPVSAFPLSTLPEAKPTINCSFLFHSYSLAFFVFRPLNGSSLPPNRLPSSGLLPDRSSSSAYDLGNARKGRRW
jgi:hypothetical protein